MLKRRTMIIILSLASLLVPAARPRPSPRSGSRTRTCSSAASRRSARPRAISGSPSSACIGCASSSPRTGRDPGRRLTPPVRPRRQRGGPERRARAVHARRQHPVPTCGTSPVRRGDRGPLRGLVRPVRIWNEPNYIALPKPSTAPPPCTASLYAAGYKAIKAHDAARSAHRRDRALRTGSPRDGAVKFLRKVACVNAQYHRVRRCTKLKADGYAHHPYDFEKAPRRSIRGKDDATIRSLRTSRVRWTRSPTPARSARRRSCTSPSTLPGHRPARAERASARAT